MNESNHKLYRVVNWWATTMSTPNNNCANWISVNVEWDFSESRDRKLKREREKERADEWPTSKCPEPARIWQSPIFATKCGFRVEQFLMKLNFCLIEDTDNLEIWWRAEDATCIYTRYTYPHFVAWTCDLVGTGFFGLSLPLLFSLARSQLRLNQKWVK